MSGGRLQGLSVLVTRPAHQCGALCALLEAEGATAVQFPVLAIEPMPDSAPLMALLRRLDAHDLAIFTSPNAVDACMELLGRHGVSWPQTVEVAAIGRATAEALESRGVSVAVCPDGPYTSEGLLAHPRLHQVAGQVILLVKGTGGRQVLAETLTERGALVVPMEVYRRIRPDADPAPLLERWRQGRLDVAVVTSLEGLDNLLALVGPQGRDALLGTGLVTVSARIAKAARARGFHDGIIVAPEASDAGLVEGLVRWHRQWKHAGASMSDEHETQRKADTPNAGKAPPSEPAPAAAAGPPPEPQAPVAAAAAAPPQAPAGTKRLAMAALLLGLLLAVVAAAGGGYLYARLQLLEASQADFASRQTVEELRDSAVGRVDRLAGRIDNLAAEHQSHLQSLAQALEALQQMRDSQARVSERIERLEALAAAHRDDWIRSEAEYLYGLARHRLELRADPRGAMAALQIADELLAELGGQAVEERRQLREQINVLLDLRPVDTERLAARLLALVDGVEQWPLRQQAVRLEPQPMGRQPQADLTTVAGWRQAAERAWEQFRASLSSLVVVRREDAPPQLLAPAEEWYLREHLRLQLHSARLALLEGHGAAYRASLAQADRWLSEHFRDDDPQLQAARKELAALLEEPVGAPLPSLPPLRFAPRGEEQ